MFDESSNTCILTSSTTRINVALVMELFSLHSLQCCPLYPFWQPLRHTPFTWKQVVLFTQLPLQFSLQATPKCPGKHSTWQMLHSSCSSCKTTWFHYEHVLWYINLMTSIDHYNNFDVVNHNVLRGLDGLGQI